jgi:hypothetical protein
MSYIKNVLQPGEMIRYVGITHWMLYFPSHLACGGRHRNTGPSVGCVSAVWVPASNCLLDHCLHRRGPRLVEALDDGDRCHGSSRDLRPRLLRPLIRRSAHEPSRKRRCRPEPARTSL